MTPASTLTRVAACNPEPIPRTDEALQSPQRNINANQILADEYREAGRIFLRIAITVGLTLLMVSMLAGTAVKAGPKLRWDLAWGETIKALK